MDKINCDRKTVEQFTKVFGVPAKEAVSALPLSHQWIRVPIRDKDQARLADASGKQVFSVKMQDGTIHFFMLARFEDIIDNCL